MGFKILSCIIASLCGVLLSQPDILAAADIIIDNGAPGTSYTGWWEVSSGASPYGPDSLWSRDDSTYYWQFSPAEPGSYEVSMWWSDWPSRASAVPVEIQYSGGIFQFEIDQSSNAGQWNSLGEYYFDSSGKVTITAVNDSDLSTCADAVRFLYISDNTPPVAEILSITPNPAAVGETVTFSGSGSDTDGSVVAYSWESDLDGYVGGSAEFSSSGLSEGSHTITLKVQDDRGSWSVPVTQALRVGEPTGEVIIDNRDPETSWTGTWEQSSGTNPFGEDSVWSRDSSSFRWHFTPPQSGIFEVSMWWTEWPSRSSSVPVEIEHAGGTSRVYVNQLHNGGQWNDQGIYYFEAGVAYTVTITAQASPTSTCADAVRFVFVSNSSEPAVIIKSPVDYHLQVASDLTVKSETQNLESGWGVRFVLDAGTTGEKSQIDDTAPFEAIFNDVLHAEHTIDVQVVDAYDFDVVGSYTHDRVAQIGIGDYLVAIGDSITEGYRDDEPLDDISLDGRNGGGGYEPILNDLLTSWDGIPHTVFNEGVGGALSEDGAASIQGVLARHPGARAYLVQYGTNDSAWWNDVPSGLHLWPGDPGYDGSFKDNMQQIIGAIQADGKDVYLAKIPPALGESSTSTPFANPEEEERNILIREYNQVVDELVQSNAINLPPPDFYGYFTEYNAATGLYRYEEEFADNLHPNGIGYQSMGNLWSTVLTQPAAGSKTSFIDNRDTAATTSTGTWGGSDGEYPFGEDSYWSRDGATFTWIFQPQETGTYELSMWWTEWPSRSSNVPVDISHASGGSRVYVNQLENGGRWNSLGQYTFEGGSVYHITLTAQPGSSSTCADALRFTLLSPT